MNRLMFKSYKQKQQLEHDMKTIDTAVANDVLF